MLKDFVNNNDIIKAQQCVDENFLIKIQMSFGIKMGKELTDYILNYGFLIYDSVELYGINAKQKECSDLISQTIYLHKYFDKTKGFFALENIGDGMYSVINSNDEVFVFDSIENVINKTNLSLNEYILKRFNEI